MDYIAHLNCLHKNCPPYLEGPSSPPRGYMDSSVIFVQFLSFIKNMLIDRLYIICKYVHFDCTNCKRCMQRIIRTG